VFPQLKGVNRGEFREFDGRIARSVRSKGAVNIELSFQYGSGGARPISIIYDVYRDRVRIQQGSF
jgi:hypothetical protein